MKRNKAVALVCVLCLAGCSAGGGTQSRTAETAPPGTAAQMPSSTCEPTVGEPHDQAATLRSLLAKDMRRYALNAVIFGATRDTKPILITAIGNSMPSLAASTSMHFRIGMPAEQMLTTLLLQLVDQRRIALTDNVSKWFPNYPHASVATVRMLAASSAGFGDYVYGPADPARRIPSFGDLLDQNPLRSFTAAALIRRSQTPYQVPQYPNPGGNWMYSHTGFVMLGSILASVTKQAYPDLIRSSIFQKLGLHETVFPTTPEIDPPVLHAFTSERGRYEDSTAWDPSWTSFSGNVNSTVCDLVKWEGAFGTGALLSAKSFAQIAAPTNVGLGMNKRNLYFGLGTIVANGWLEGAGNYFGWHTASAYYPPSHIAFAITLTETPATKNAATALNDILTQVSTVLVPRSPIVFPTPAAAK